MKKSILVILPVGIIGLSLVLVGLYWIASTLRVRSVNDFEQCKEMGYPIRETYPEQCVLPDGRVFVQKVEPTETPPVLSEDIKVYNPVQDQFISSPLEISGEALGSWFWEGSFTADLLNQSGELIGNAIITHQSGTEWMTEEYVPFGGTLEFDVGNAGTDGILVFHKANPSAMAENNESYSLPIKFKLSKALDGCVITGCSSQICAEEDQATTCEFLETYACYRNATCQKQADGKCGWTMTEELQSCLSQ